MNVKLGGITANYLSETLREDEIWYGLGKGIVQHSQPACVFTPLEVVQLSGVHPGIEFSQGPVDLIHKIAAISHGKAHPMYVPMWVDDESLAKTIG